MKHYTLLTAPAPEPHQSRESILLYGPDGTPIDPSSIGGGPGGPGADGLSAYQIAVENGFSGTEQQWLASLVGPAGAPASINWASLQAWVNQAWTAGSLVTWLGSTFVALSDIASGGANPYVDTTNWKKVAHGSAEVAYAQYVAAAGGRTVPAAVEDLPGTQIVVPAGTPDFWLEVFGQFEIKGPTTVTAPNYPVAICALIAYDVDAAAINFEANYRNAIPGSNQLADTPTIARKRIAGGSPTARTFKMQQSGLYANSGSALLRADGVYPPAYLRATIA